MDLFSARRYITFFKILLILGFVYFFWLMLKITLEYIPLDPNVSFLMIKQTEVEQRPEYLYFFYTHVYTSIFVLLSGFSPSSGKISDGKISTGIWEKSIFFSFYFWLLLQGFIWVFLPMEDFFQRFHS